MPPAKAMGILQAQGKQRQLKSSKSGRYADIKHEEYYIMSPIQIDYGTGQDFKALDKALGEFNASP